MKFHCFLPALLLALLFAPAVTHAHFVWVAVTGEGDQQQLQFYFSEAAEPGEPELLERIESPQAIALVGDAAKELPFKLTGDTLAASLADAAGGIYVVSYTYGVISRGDEPFLLQYYAKTGPESASPQWQQRPHADQLRFDVTPQVVGNKIQLTATFDGRPLSGAEVTVEGPRGQDEKELTNKQGQVSFRPKNPGLYSIRVKHVQDTAGKFGGENYADIRHYATLSLPVATVGQAEDNPADTTEAAPTPKRTEGARLPDVPNPVTSFGGAVLDGHLYIYGGHEGEPHTYYHEAQAKTLWQLNLAGKPAWKQVAEGPGLQGLAMVAHGGKLYRLGGFTAKNSKQEKNDLWSQDSVASFDPKTRKWTELPSLPQPRSSFDAAVLGDTIFVIGGWQLAGDADAVWHKTAYSLDLSQQQLRWEPLPKAPFVRRAHSVAAHEGKIYAIGGMQEDGGPTTEVAIYDPQSKKWSAGPALPGKGMEGFGSSAFATGGRLYVSTISGELLRLSANGSAWEKAGKLKRERFFHRMLPVAEGRLIFVGGASMSVGKFPEVEIVTVE